MKCDIIVTLTTLLFPHRPTSLHADEAASEGDGEEETEEEEEEAEEEGRMKRMKSPQLSPQTAKVAAEIDEVSHVTVGPSFFFLRRGILKSA